MCKITTFILLILVTTCWSVPTHRFRREAGYETTTQLDELRSPESESVQLSKISPAGIEPHPTTSLPRFTSGVTPPQDQSLETDPNPQSTDTPEKLKLENQPEQEGSNGTENPAASTSLGETSPEEKQGEPKADNPNIGNSKTETPATESGTEPSTGNNEKGPSIIDAENSNPETQDNSEGDSQTKNLEAKSLGDQTTTEISVQEQVQTESTEDQDGEKTGESQEPEHLSSSHSEEHSDEELADKTSVSDLEKPIDGSENLKDSKQEGNTRPDNIVTPDKDLNDAPPESSQPNVESKVRDGSFEANENADEHSIEPSLSNEAQADEPASSGEDLASIGKSDAILDQLPSKESTLQSDNVNGESPLQDKISEPGTEYENPGGALPKDTLAKETKKMEQVPKYLESSEEDKSLDSSMDPYSLEKLDDESAPSSTGTSSTNLSIWDRLQAMNPLQLQAIQGYLPTWETLNQVQSWVPSWESINEMQSMIPWDSINQLQTNIPTWVNQLQTNVPIWMNQLQSSSPWQSMSQLINQWQPMDQIRSWAQSYPELGNMMNAFMNLFSQ